MTPSPATARRWYAEDLRLAAPITQTPALVEAFATVPREHYLGPGPWRIIPRRRDAETITTPDAAPHHVYHDVLITIDEARDLNNGQPTLWAYVFDQLDLRMGQTVLQVGVGVGYYTAIIAELVGPQGRVIAYEIDDPLAVRAAENLKAYGNVEVIPGDATKAEHLSAFDCLIAFAGATHVPPAWLHAMRDGGRMMLPITAANGWGFLMHLSKEKGAMPVRSLGPCGFYPCIGARDNREAEALGEALAARHGEPLRLRAYCIGAPQPDDASAWYIGKGFWISSEAAAQLA